MTEEINGQSKTPNKLRLALFGMVALLILVWTASMILDYYSTARLRDATAKPAPTPTTIPEPAIKYIVPEEIDLMHGQKLLDELRGGGYILFARHFQTDHSKWHQDPIKAKHAELTVEDFQTCETQRPLTNYGRLRAKMVGDVIRKHRIPIGKALSSPYCRCSEGAERLLGRELDETPYGLIYRGGNYTRKMMSEYLLTLLDKVPEGPYNTLIMAHRAQMDDVDDIAEGQIFVFHPLGDGKFNLVAKIFDYEWLESLLDVELLGLASVKDVPATVLDEIDARF